MANLGKVEKSVKIKLGDGGEYEMAPLDLNLMVDIEDKFEKPFGALFREGRVKPLRYALWLLIKDSAPNLKSESDLGSLITARVLVGLQSHIAKQLGDETETEKEA